MNEDDPTFCAPHQLFKMRFYSLFPAQSASFLLQKFIMTIMRRSWRSVHGIIAYSSRLFGLHIEGELIAFYGRQSLSRLYSCHLRRPLP